MNPLTHADLLNLKRWNTPTIYNGWEQITSRDPARDAFNLEETRDFMPEMGPMVGHAVTVVIQPSQRRHREEHPNAWSDYRRYVAEAGPAPKIVVVQDLDKPHTIGAFWGEVNSNIHRALGCVGTIIDGAIRDVDEMKNAGFKALARRFCVGHAYSHPVRWGCEVEVFGRTIRPGDLIHADKHGFIAISADEAPRLLDAARFMDENECATLIPAARNTTGRSREEILQAIDEAGAAFGANVKSRFNRGGEF
jgi:4-hydroxy-4-methyl-2-oxoglutarate aldolase